MSRAGRFEENWLDDYIMARVLGAREAASLGEEQLAVLRAAVRFEILSSDVINKTIFAKTQEVMRELGVTEKDCG